MRRLYTAVCADLFRLSLFMLFETNFLVLLLLHFLQRVKCYSVVFVQAREG